MDKEGHHTMQSSENPSTLLTIAVDAMGGDYAPAEVVKGAVEAVRGGKVRVILVGDPMVVGTELDSYYLGDTPISLVPSEGMIQETEQPVTAIRQKPRASVVEAVKLVKAGKAQAAVTMGSTGAATASAALVLGLLDGVERPALGGPLLDPLSQTVLVDLGANMDCRPTQLLGFAAIGCAFARSVQGIGDPRVALLSVGAEAEKGNRQVQEAHPIFKESGLNFVGNVEGGDLFLDRADVVVCDGFIGNVLMKFGEGMSLALIKQLRKLLDGRFPAEELDRLEQEVYTLTNAVERAGGGPLLGVDGIVVVGHGRSRASSVTGAIEMARSTVEMGLVESMRRELAKVHTAQGGSSGRA